MDGTTIGAGLGAAAGSIIPGIGTLLGSSLGGLFGGLFGGPDTVDTSIYRNQMNRYNALGNRFLNPNDSFYTDATKRQKQSLLDLMMAGNRQAQSSLARQGIQSSALNNINNQHATNKAAEGANQFAMQNYKQGLGFANSMFGMAGQTLGQLGGANQYNTQMQNEFQNSGMNLFGDMAMNLLANRNPDSTNTDNTFSGSTGHLGNLGNVYTPPTTYGSMRSPMNNLFGNGFMNGYSGYSTYP